MSLMCSVPMDSLIVDGEIPWSNRSSVDSWECVVDAGWMTNDLTSATFASSENSSRLSMNFFASSSVPSMSKVKIDPAPFGKYLL